MIVNSEGESEVSIFDTVTSNYHHHKGKKMIRKARLDEIKEIQRLIKLYAPRGGILPGP